MYDTEPYTEGTHSLMQRLTAHKVLMLRQPQKLLDDDQPLPGGTAEANAAILALRAQAHPVDRVVRHVQAQAQFNGRSMREALKNQPDSSEMRWHLAGTLVQSGNKSEASKELDRLLASQAAFPRRAEAQTLLAKQPAGSRRCCGQRPFTQDSGKSRGRRKSPSVPLFQRGRRKSPSGPLFQRGKGTAPKGFHRRYQPPPLEKGG